MSDVYDEVRAEIQHSLDHSILEREDIRDLIIDAAEGSYAKWRVSYRKDMIRIAALAIAAIESLDRKGNGG